MTTRYSNLTLSKAINFQRDVAKKITLSAH